MQHRRSFTVNYTAPGGKFANRYPALAHLPFILDTRPGYHRLGNAYLNDRGLGLWGPTSGADRPAGRISSPRSMHNYAQWLANFLEWADLRGVDVHTCDYTTHIAGRYQLEMLKGLWSRDGTALAPTTVNLRVQQACDFFTWMCDTGRRSEFHIPYKKVKVINGSAISSMGHVGYEVRARQGKVRAKQPVLQMPSDKLVSQWLSRVYERRGLILGLMCETVLLTAMRREEVVCLHKDTLPEDPSQWCISNPLAPPEKQLVRITIKYGTKGQSYGTSEQGDKIGPERDILIPFQLAQKWHEYRRHERNGAFAKWMAGFKGAARHARARQCAHLFLRESDGARFSGPSLYDAWTSVELPIDGWSPHAGRHWWACSTLWRELKGLELVKNVTNETAAALLDNTAIGTIRLQIQPQLGHASESTTMLYLRWVRDMVSLPVSLALTKNNDEILAEESKGE